MHGNNNNNRFLSGLVVFERQVRQTMQFFVVDIATSKIWTFEALSITGSKNFYLNVFSKTKGVALLTSEDSSLVKFKIFRTQNVVDRS